jgi:hypothetical protein
MGFFDGPERIVVVIHGKSGDRLLAASSRVIDVVRVQAVWMKAY